MNVPIKQTIQGRYVPVKIWTRDVDSASLDQLRATASLPFVYRHVAAMPDVHLGVGATIGSVVPTHRAIIPAAVGVDIGCGMAATRTNLGANDLPDSLSPLRSRIESLVPVGFNRHRGEVSSEADRKWHQEHAAELYAGYQAIERKHPRIVEKGNTATLTSSQLGTLGGGNHFIEVCLDEENRVWVMLHSGSRQLGNRIGTYFIEKAKVFATRNRIKDLPHRDLAYLPEGEQLFTDYVEAVSWAQDYARVNRETMMRLVFRALQQQFPQVRWDSETAVNCHHNYVQREHHFGEDVLVTRKGAIRAGQGELGIIPGSMGARSFIVRGKGNPESFESCSHGAGRRMSRKAAKRRFKPDDLRKQTMGVECRKDAGVLDEIPSAYKPIDEVMANQTDLVDVVHTLKQVVCVKG